MKMRVYIAGREQGPIKLGISRNPPARISALQTGCPFQIKLLHQGETTDAKKAWSEEQTFHRHVAEARIYGEWFNLDAETAISIYENQVELNAHFEKMER